MVSAQQQGQAHDPNADLFDWYFRCADTDRDGHVSKPEAFAFLRRSGLSIQVISKVWDYVDQNKTGFLGRTEFYNILKLVAVAQSKRELTPETMKAALDSPATDRIQAPWIDFAATGTSQEMSAAASPSKDGAIASLSGQKQGGNALSSTKYHEKQEASAVSTPISSSTSSEASVSSNNHDNYQTSHPKQHGGCQPVRKPGPVTMDHVLLALGETKEEREQRIRSLFSFFDTANAGYLDYMQIENGLSALQIPSEYKYARDLLNVCDANKDGRVDYQEFKRYMDDKELELYCIFQAIDVEHNGCILPEELYDALLKAGIEIDDEELATFVERVDKDNNGVITFEEWRDFLLLYPHEATMENIYHYLERVCLVDIGEQTVIPEGISKNVHASRYLIAGGVAGAVSRTATAPLDRLKVILQVQTTKARAMPAIKSIWKEGGFLGFFRGNGLNVLKVAPESAIRFYTYEMLKDVIVKAKGGQDKGDIGAVGRLFAGGLAGAVAQTSVYPMDLVKTRLQTYACEGGKVPNLAVMSRDIWVQEGPRALYRGLVPSVLGIIPYAGIDLATYETLKDISKKYILHDEADGIMRLNWTAETGPVVQLGCGMVSGALGATCVYPLQVVRTRMQAHPTNTDGAYKGMSDVFKRTFQREGFRGFYKGLFPNMLKVVPSASITYLVYETMKKSLHLE